MSAPVQTDQMEIPTASADAMRAVLLETRQYLAADLHVLLECACVVNPLTGNPDEVTMEDDDAEVVAELRGLIAKIDGVLGTPAAEMIQ